MDGLRKCSNKPSRISFSQEKDEIFSARQMELEVIMLSDISQAQKKQTQLDLMSSLKTSALIEVIGLTVVATGWEEKGMGRAD